MMAKRIFHVLCTMLAATIFSTMAVPDEAAGGENWDFSLAPLYLWATSISGEQTIRGIPIDVSTSFSDTVSDLDGALTFHFEGVRRQRWGFLADLMLIRLNPKQGTPIGDIEVNYKDVLAELGGFYRWNKGAHNFDALVGLRYSSMDVELNFPGPLPTIDQYKSWLDPIVGARWLWQFTEKWKLSLRGDIGGFGVGSDFAWNLIGLVHFQPWKHVAFFGGYRALYQNYKDGRGANYFEFDATMHGPAIGLNIIW